MRSAASRTKQYAATGLLSFIWLAGCASPGPPRPPSLQLPTIVTDLTVERDHDSVTLHFTAPTRSTDKMPLKKPITAAVCRQAVSAQCVEILRKTLAADVTQKGSKDSAITLEDPLPSALTAGSPVLLAYRVTLFNDKGKTAGASKEVFAVGGAVPAPVTGLAATPSRSGAVLHWQPVPDAGFVELRRVLRQTQPPAPKPPKAKPADAKPAQAKPASPLAPPSAPTEVTLSSGEIGSDLGGTVDPTAQFGQSYTYTAWRVRKLTVSGHAMEMHSAISAPLVLDMHDIFPPVAPQGLIAVPATGGGGIDLSWEPNVEPDLAGYYIYRAAIGSIAAPVRLNGTPVEVPAYHDSSAAQGSRYRYTVSAVDQSGNESGHSAAIEEGIE